MEEEQKKKFAEKDKELKEKDLEKVSGGVGVMLDTSWRCTRCGELNSVYTSTCSKCGATK